jgi:hypothetical protein
MDTETVAVSRRSRAAFVALGLLVAGLTIGTALGASGRVSASPSDPPAWLVVAALVVFGAFIASVVIGIVALIRIHRASGGLTGRIAARVSVIVSALVLTPGSRARSHRPRAG